jgi:hypothetical protein
VPTTLDAGADAVNLSHGESVGGAPGELVDSDEEGAKGRCCAGRMVMASRVSGVAKSYSI